MKLALCNEVLAPWPFVEQCRLASALGYAALEVAPYTVCDDPQTMTVDQARALRQVAADHGLEISGLHWLLVKPQGLSITHAEATVRDRTVAFMRHLCELCAAMGGRYLVHGSPGQRRVPEGSSHEQALDRATQAWARAGDAAAACGVTYCIEPLSRDQTDVVNTVAEAVAVVKAVGQQALRTMIDTSSAGLAEDLPVPALIERWLPSGYIAHLQVNDPNRRAPGQGELQFGPVLAAMQRGGWDGWVAVEPFDYVPDGPGCAAWSAGYLKGLQQALGAHK
ncbi:MAG: sugar phosphate isomerase/epimerase family protein [Rubrivivax sp.]